MTPFFQELMNDLLQGEINTANAEQAYLNYLKKLDEVARLEMAGLCQETSSDGLTNTVHFFGRTAASPNVYYYRSLTQTWDTITSAWMNLWAPWEQINVDIQGDQLVPVVWNNRLYIFWPLYTETADPIANPPPASSTNPPPPPTKCLQIQMAWSEYKQQTWTKKQVSSSTLIPQQFASYQYVAGSPGDPLGQSGLTSLALPILDPTLATQEFQVPTGFTDSFFCSSSIDATGNLVISIYVNFSNLYGGSRMILSGLSYSMAITTPLKASLKSATLRRPPMPRSVPSANRFTRRWRSI